MSVPAPEVQRANFQVRRRGRRRIHAYEIAPVLLVANGPAPAAASLADHSVAARRPWVSALAKVAYNRAAPARVAKLVDARDLKEIEHPAGNGRCEWGQIRGNSTTRLREA